MKTLAVKWPKMAAYGAVAMLTGFLFACATPPKDATLIQDLQAGKRTCVEQECHPVIHSKPMEKEEPAHEKEGG